MTAKFNHVNLLAISPADLRDFYIEVFGFSVIDQMSDPPSFIMLDGNGCRLSVQDATLVNQAIGTKGVELGIEVSDLSLVIDKLAKYPTLGQPSQQHMGWGQAISTTDPEGHLLNVYAFDA